MSSIRETATPSTTDPTRALSIISKWTARYAKGNVLRPVESTNPVEVIEKAIARKLIARERIFDQHLPFSWPRFLVGLVSLVLVFSDVFRSGLSVSSLQALYPMLQPDEAVNFGTSWNHSVFNSTKDEAISCNTTARVWSYKFDSTSISWRAFARYFDLAEFPGCIFYREKCPSKVMCGGVAFNMIDSLVDAMANATPTLNQARPAKFGPVTLSLRTQSNYVDRFHQLLLPTWFTNVNSRTNQALYYSPEVLSRTNAKAICFPAIGGRVHTPHFCQQLWTNFQRSCASTDSTGKAVGLLYVHALNRVRDIQARFPNLTVELTLLESQDDLQVIRGGLSSVGIRWTDVSTIIRARNCTNDGACETLYVDDYRYETGAMLTDIVEWYRAVAALRIIGQGYFFVRGIGLMLSCYYVYNTPSMWEHVRKACRLFMKVPTQCVVYGSPFPVACYVLAHLLDAQFTYQELDSRFISVDGAFNFNIESFISYTVIQMRNVWVYSLVWHVVVTISTSRWMGRNNQPNRGVIGVPEFLLSGFSCMTLVAQYRSTSFRSTKILNLSVLPDNLGHAWDMIKYRDSFRYRGRGNEFLGGVIIDLKFLICSVFTVAACRVVRMAWVFYQARKYDEDKHKYLQWFILSPTPVPYSAGILWPTISMCVHWTSDYFCIQESHRGTRSRSKVKLMQRGKIRGCLRRGGRILPFTTISRYSTIKKLSEELRKHKGDTPSVRMDVNTFRYIQHQMKCLHGRSDIVEANVAFMNAVLLSDPLVYLRLVFGRDPSMELAYYRSLLRSQQILLLPVAVVGEHNEFSHGLQLLKPVTTSDLSWTGLVQCG